MISTYLAYKHVAIAVMLAELNYCSSNLQLKVDLPIRSQDVRGCNVFDQKLVGFSGRIDTEKYSFSFLSSGRLRFITRIEDGGRQSYGIVRGQGEPMGRYMERLSQRTSMINTNDAYRIATNWLASIEVDLNKLEKEKPPTVEQQFLKTTTRGLVPVPLFYVRWGDRNDPTVHILISGISGGLLYLRQEDVVYSKRPAALLRDLDKLLAIPDAEFLKYSPSETSNLVVQFSAVLYPASTHAVNTVKDGEKPSGGNESIPRGNLTTNSEEKAIKNQPR